MNIGTYKKPIDLPAPAPQPTIQEVKKMGEAQKQLNAALAPIKDLSKIGSEKARELLLLSFKANDAETAARIADAHFDYFWVQHTKDANFRDDWNSFARKNPERFANELASVRGGVLRFGSFAADAGGAIWNMSKQKGTEFLRNAYTPKAADEDTRLPGMLTSFLPTAATPLAYGIMNSVEPFLREHGLPSSFGELFNPGLLTDLIISWPVSLGTWPFTGKFEYFAPKVHRQIWGGIGDWTLERLKHPFESAYDAAVLVASITTLPSYLDALDKTKIAASDGYYQQALRKWEQEMDEARGSRDERRITQLEKEKPLPAFSPQAIEAAANARQIWHLDVSMMSLWLFGAGGKAYAEGAKAIVKQRIANQLLARELATAAELGLDRSVAVTATKQIMEEMTEQGLFKGSAKEAAQGASKWGLEVAPPTVFGDGRKILVEGAKLAREKFVTGMQKLGRTFDNVYGATEQMVREYWQLIQSAGRHNEMTLSLALNCRDIPALSRQAMKDALAQELVLLRAARRDPATVPRSQLAKWRKEVESTVKKLDKEGFFNGSPEEISAKIKDRFGLEIKPAADPQLQAAHARQFYQEWQEQSARRRGTPGANVLDDSVEDAAAEGAAVAAAENLGPKATQQLNSLLSDAREGFKAALGFGRTAEQKAAFRKKLEASVKKNVEILKARHKELSDQHEKLLGKLEKATVSEERLQLEWDVKKLNVRIATIEKQVKRIESLLQKFDDAVMGTLYCGFDVVYSHYAALGFPRDTPPWLRTIRAKLEQRIANYNEIWKKRVEAQKLLDDFAFDPTGKKLEDYAKLKYAGVELEEAKALAVTDLKWEIQQLGMQLRSAGIDKMITQVQNAVLTAAGGMLKPVGIGLGAYAAISTGGVGILFIPIGYAVDIMTARMIYSMASTMPYPQVLAVVPAADYMAHLASDFEVSSKEAAALGKAHRQDQSYADSLTAAAKIDTTARQSPFAPMFENKGKQPQFDVTQYGKSIFITGADSTPAAPQQQGSVSNLEQVEITNAREVEGPYADRVDVVFDPVNAGPSIRVSYNLYIGKNGVPNEKPAIANVGRPEFRNALKGDEHFVQPVFTMPDGTVVQGKVTRALRPEEAMPLQADSTQMQSQMSAHLQWWEEYKGKTENEKVKQAASVIDSLGSDRIIEMLYSLGDDNKVMGRLRIIALREYKTEEEIVDYLR